MSNAGENNNECGHHAGFGPNQLCGESPKISGE
jgi:hypothetical protein